MTEYHAFYATYDGITDEIITPASIIPLYTNDPTLRGVPVKIEAVWDTGATDTCIKPSLWERLKLYPLEFGRRHFSGIGGGITADLTLVDILLTPKFKITRCPVYITDFPGDSELLIGMNIVTMGDFVVCNTDNKTSFSFAVPSFPDRINFVEKAKAANKGNTT